MKLLFREAAQNCYQPETARIKKLESWIAQAESARAKGNLEPRPNQYDKAEELVTLYTFAPLVLGLNKVGLTNRILGLAGVSPFEENMEDWGLERQYPPSAGYLKWLRNYVKNHPISYIRQQADEHRTNQRLESNTHVDASIRTDKLLILFEIKFTSDISYGTTFNPCRNQLARLIDVGLEAVKSSGKEVLVVLAAPSEFYANGGRFYYYKVKDYSDPVLIQKDIPWRHVSQIRDSLLAVKLIDLKDLISLLYKDFVHPDREQAMVFFKERNLA